MLALLPEVVLRDVRGQRAFVGLTAIKVILFTIDGANQVLRTDVPQQHTHRRGDPGSDGKEPKTSVERAVAGWRIGLDTFLGHSRGRCLETRAALEQHVVPGRSRIETPAIFLRETPVECSPGGTGHCRSVAQDLFYALIRLEGLAFDNSDSGERAHDLKGEHTARFLLYDLVQHIEVGVIAGRQRVDSQPCPLDVLNRFDGRGLPRMYLAFE